MNRRFLGIFFLISSLAIGGLPAEATAEALGKYRAWHDVCLQGDVKTIDLQIDKFEQQLAANPKDSLAKAFLGSACALRAKFGKWGPTKLSFLKRGRKLMEEAVAASPTDARVRMVRAIAYYRIPKRFGVRDTSVADFQALVPAAKAGGKLTKGERQAILYYAAHAFREEKVAGSEELLTLCRKLDPNSEYGKLAH
ncbi:hypothetical protein [Roseibacillus persicicus]|uniref:hypothetical protein n=1 Tax=Roseibacillus persicicus TaxID=454148 RepID=UPI00280FCDCB|nr:hypothetical protein [Roseibacillus persicicus]MDQ8191892.1 hypothetical protein [Roseibacillus persicicus]